MICLCRCHWSMWSAWAMRRCMRRHSMTLAQWAARKSFHLQSPLRMTCECSPVPTVSGSLTPWCCCCMGLNVAACFAYVVMVVVYTPCFRLLLPLCVFTSARELALAALFFVHTGCRSLLSPLGVDALKPKKLQVWLRPPPGSSLQQ